MDKQDYLRMLEDGHTETDAFGENRKTSRLEFLAEHIFDFTTYESEMAELFAKKAIEVCAAISDKQTFEYIRASDDNRMWYLLMCNMPFFYPRLNWGGSIRGAWWDVPIHKKVIEFSTCGLFWQGEQIDETIKFTLPEWEQFIAAVREFSAGSNQPNDRLSGAGTASA